MKMRKRRHRPQHILFYVGGGDYCRSSFWHQKGRLTPAKPDAWWLS